MEVILYNQLDALTVDPSSKNVSTIFVSAGVFKSDFQDITCGRTGGFLGDNSSERFSLCGVACWDIAWRI